MTIASRAAALLLVVCLLLPLSLAAQDARGTVLGRVTDQSGASVPDADVRAVNTATGVVAAARSNQQGNFVLPYLLPGTYNISVELAGFKKFVQENVQVRVNDSVELNPMMTIGNLTETVEVTAETPLLSTAEASLGHVIDEKRVMELPLFAGNAMDLVQLAPGVANGTDLRLRKAPFNAAPSQFSTDGAGNNNNEFTIDGVSNTYSDGTAPRVAFSPPATAIAEFRVQTSPFDASVGHTTGSVVNVSTKGGTNELHGELHHWLRHSTLDAPTIFQNRSGQKLPIYQDNRYGGSAGAPVVIPGLYNGKNKTFWYFNYEANKFGDPNVGASTSTVPRAAWREGDFSDLLKLGSKYQLYNPKTIRAMPDGTYKRDPYPGNIIPKSDINAVGQKLINLYPMPNQEGSTDGRNNFFRSGKALEDYWVMLARFDHAFSESHRMFFRLHRDYWQEDKNRNFGDDLTGVILNRINRGLALDDVYVFSPSFLVNVRYGITQQEFPEHRVSQGFDLSSLGFSPEFLKLIPDPKLSAVPNVTAGSLTALSGSESGDGTTASLTHSINGNFTMLKGDHTLRFGPELRVYREFRNRYTNDVSPSLQFSNAWARGPFNTSTAPQVGAEMVAMLLGIPNGNMSRSASYAEQDKYLALYLQDDWKISRKLTVNLGLRYEYESPITERFNRSVAGFAFGVSNPIEAAAKAAYAKNPIPELPADQFRVIGGPTFVGVGGNPRNYWEGQKLNFSPRIGLAYQLFPKTVIRTGYGIFYGSIGVNATNSIQAGFSRTTSMLPSVDNGVTFIASLENPFPDGLIQPPGAAGGLTTNLSQDITYFEGSRKQPYNQKWSFGIQQELPAKYLVEVSYVGARAARLGVQKNLNFTPEQYLTTDLLRNEAHAKYWGASFKNPFYGLDPAWGSTMGRTGFLEAYPQFNNVYVNLPVGYSWYHSMQTRIEKRFSHGYNFQAGYTWSKSMTATSFLNAFDAMPYEELSSADRPHRFTLSAQWELPFGKKRSFGANWHPALNFIAGGWNLNMMVQKQVDDALGFGDAIFIGDPSKALLPKSQRSPEQWFNKDVFLRDSTLTSRSYAVRYMPNRFSNIRSDMQSRWDFSAIKKFQMTERFVWEFRAECFNAWNHPNLRNPNTTPTSSSFGVTTQQEPPRSWQGALRLNF